MNHDQYDKDILRALQRIANSLERIDRRIERNHAGDEAAKAVLAGMTGESPDESFADLTKTLLFGANKEADNNGGV